MTKETEIARSLKENDQINCMGEFYCATIGGVRITHPFDYIKMTSYMDPISPGHYECMVTANEVFSPGAIPSDWADLIEDVGWARKKKCCETPFDPICAMDFLARESEEARDLGLTMFPVLENDGFPDLRDPIEITSRIELIVRSPRLRDLFIDYASILIPDVSAEGVDRRKVIFRA